MKPIDTKAKFIGMKAGGLSYSAIANKLDIAKSTCYQWGKELIKEISRAKRDQLRELYNAYGMARTARIKQIGKVVKKINKELENIDLKGMRPETLLALHLKYCDALQAQYLELTESEPLQSVNAEKILDALTQLHARARDGNITPEQLNNELAILRDTARIFETSELEKKIEAIEQTIKK